MCHARLLGERQNSADAAIRRAVEFYRGRLSGFRAIFQGNNKFGRRGRGACAGEGLAGDIPHHNRQRVGHIIDHGTGAIGDGSVKINTAIICEYGCGHDTG